jgi:hypothetical protein
VILSDKEIEKRTELVLKFFIQSLPIRCTVGMKNFPDVTFKIFFLYMFEPPDCQYVCSLLGFGGVLKHSDDPYCVIINVKFEDDNPFVFYEAVNNLKPLKKYINHIIIPPLIFKVYEL